MIRSKDRLLLACACAVDSQARVLLVRRDEPELPRLHGNLELPGGKVEFGEGAAIAAAREIFEETGVRAHALRMLSVPYEAVRSYPDRDVCIFIVCFLCEVEDGSPPASFSRPNKIGEVLWVPLRELNPLALQSAALLFLNTLASERQPGEPYPNHSAQLMLRDERTGSDYGLVLEAALGRRAPFVLRRLRGRSGAITAHEAEVFHSRDTVMHEIDRLVRERRDRYGLLRRDKLFPSTQAISELPLIADDEAAALFAVS